MLAVATGAVMVKNKKITITGPEMVKCKFLEEKTNILFA